MVRLQHYTYSYNLFYHIIHKLSLCFKVIGYWSSGHNSNIWHVSNPAWFLTHANIEKLAINYYIFPNLTPEVRQKKSDLKINDYLLPILLFWQTLMVPASQKEKVPTRTSLEAITLDSKWGKLFRLYLEFFLKITCFWDLPV